MTDAPDTEYRVALLGKNMKFKNKPALSVDHTRLIFFEDKNINDNDYALFVGKSKDIQEQMNKMDVCIYKSGEHQKLFVKAEKKNLSDLNEMGLLKGETPITFVPDANVNFDSNWGY